MTEQQETYEADPNQLHLPIEEYKTLGDLIAARMKDAGFKNWNRLSKAAGVGDGVLSRIRNGYTVGSLHTLIKVFRLIPSITMQDLLKVKEYEQATSKYFKSKP